MMGGNAGWKERKTERETDTEVHNLWHRDTQTETESE